MKYNQPYGVSDPNAPYINGNPSTGTMGSIPPAASIEHPQRELVNLISKAGFTPDVADLMQALKAVRSGALNYLIDTGTADALAVALDPPLDAYTVGLPLRILKTLTANASSVPTLSVNGLAAKTMVRADGGPLAAGDIPAGYMLLAVYDGVKFRIINLAATATSPPNYVLAAARNTVIYNVVGAFGITVPANIYALHCRVWAAGGGGGGCDQSNLYGYGGGAGEYREGIFAVTPGQVLPVIVGAGGSFGSASPAGQGGTGGTSSIGTLISAIGGGGGKANAGTAGGGQSGAGGFGGIGLPGLSGGPGFPSGPGLMGGGGGSAFCGHASGNNYADNGSPGIQPAGGAAGASGISGPHSGGSGGAGLIIIQY